MMSKRKKDRLSRSAEVDPNDAAPAERAAVGEDDAPPDDALELDDVTSLIEALEGERDEAVAARQRALADYSNFQRRAAENESRAYRDGVYSVIQALVPVLDHFDLALDQDPERVTIDQLLGGVRIVQRELRKAVEAFGVRRIEPKVGDEFDPKKHEAMMRQPREGVAPNHIVAVLQAGYEAGDRIVRPAKVAVAPDEEGEQHDGEEEGM